MTPMYGVCVVFSCVCCARRCIKPLPLKFCFPYARAESVRVPRKNIIFEKISQKYATAVHVLLTMNVSLTDFVKLNG